jgi:hypothetical protein
MEVTMRTTQAVLDNHLTCFGARDLDGILSDYAENAILFTPEGALKGPDEIKPLFERLLAEFGKPGASFSMKTMSVDGGYAYIIWSAETADNVYELATDTFVVRNGKIVVQSFAGKITPRTQASARGSLGGQLQERRRGGLRSACFCRWPSFSDLEVPGVGDQVDVPSGFPSTSSRSASALFHDTELSG